MKKVPRLVTLASVAALLAGLLAGTGVAGASTTPNPDCQLNSAGGQIKHVISLIFDNVHFLRDDPNVPSDLEQMPNLKSFIENSGTLLTNDHTVLISHTANGILTYLTGMYADRHGQPVTNSYRYFRADGSTASSSSFKYWTDLTDDVNATPTDPYPNMVNADSGIPKITPAPWVPYTKAGCDYGAVALANVVLENTGTGPAGDMTKVFGAGSPEWLEAQASNAAPAGTPERQLAQTDFVGIDVHCEQGANSICAGNPNAKADQLPDEPGGYTGFKGLFGAKYVNPVITGGSPVVNNLSGQPITDQFGQPGFPGFDGLFASTTLSYVAHMQESGIPVTYGYISDAHDSHGVAGEIHTTRGPGETPYVQQLQAYDQAFGQFFSRLAADGITKENTLFIFTVEEGDHFVGHQTTPGCDGVSTPCEYNPIGEVNMNLTGQLATQMGITTPFTVHADMAPTIYITGNPTRTAPVTRNFGRALAQLTAVNPYTGHTDHVTAALADPVEMKALHMITADPQRTPTLTMFAHPDYFLFTGAANCATPCVFVPPQGPSSFAWNHGGIQPEIASTWLGIVGPGVQNLAQDSNTWVDHTDVRPTTMELVGLKDSYVHDGRVISEVLDSSALPSAYGSHRQQLARLSDAYKQLNAPFGEFCMDTLMASTAAIGSGSSVSDTNYTSIENQIQSLTQSRDLVAGQIRRILDDLAFNNTPINNSQAVGLISQAKSLMSQAEALAASSQH